jgi:hypothetical protein
MLNEEQETPTGKVTPYRSSRTQQVVIWGDLYLVGLAPLTPWVGFVIGQIFSPILGRRLGVSSDIALAIIVAVSTIIGSYLLVRMLQKRTLASPAYLAALSTISAPDERRNFDDRITWLLKRVRPLTRGDAIDTYRAAQKDVRRAHDQMRAAVILRAQKSTFDQ